MSSRMLYERQQRSLTRSPTAVQEAPPSLACHRHHLSIISLTSHCITPQDIACQADIGHVCLWCDPDIVILTFLFLKKLSTFFIRICQFLDHFSRLSRVISVYSSLFQNPFVSTIDYFPRQYDSKRDARRRTLAFKRTEERWNIRLYRPTYNNIKSSSHQASTYSQFNRFLLTINSVGLDLLSQM